MTVKIINCLKNVVSVEFQPKGIRMIHNNLSETDFLLSVKEHVKNILIKRIKENIFDKVPNIKHSIEFVCSDSDYNFAFYHAWTNSYFEIDGKDLYKLSEKDIEYITEEDSDIVMEGIENTYDESFSNFISVLILIMSQKQELDITTLRTVRFTKTGEISFHPERN